MVMVSARNVGGTYQVPPGNKILLARLTFFPSEASAVSRLTLVVLIMIAGCSSAKTIRDLGGTRRVTQVLEGMSQSLTLRWRKRETMDLRFYIYQASSVLQGRSSSTNLKYQRRNWVKAGSTRLPKVS